MAQSSLISRTGGQSPNAIGVANLGDLELATYGHRAHMSNARTLGAYRDSEQADRNC